MGKVKAAITNHENALAVERLAVCRHVCKELTVGAPRITLTSSIA
jgi:hypothetical protein